MDSGQEGRRGRSRVPLIVGVLAVVIVVGLVVFFTVFNRAGNTGPQEGPPTAHASPTASAAAGAPAGPGAPDNPAATAPAQASPEASTYTPPEMDPVDLDTPSERASGVVVRLDAVEDVHGEAQMPGEVAAPALRFTIIVRNDSPAEIDLGAVVVNGFAGEHRDPLETLSAPGGQPFDGRLAPGDEARGVYLFSVPPTGRADVTVTVDPKAGEPVSVFRGDATG